MLKILGILLAILIVVILGAWLKLRGPDIPFQTLEARYAGADSHFVDLPGGYHVHYRDDGDPNLPPLMLLHGFGDSFMTWEGWVGELKTQFHIISVDFPGHGLTRAPQGSRLNAEGLADFVDAFAAALALPKFAVAGNSMGGGAAWQLAVNRRLRLAEDVNFLGCVGVVVPKYHSSACAVRITRQLIRVAPINTPDVNA